MRFEKDIVNVFNAPVFVSMHQHACISAHQCASVCISMHQLASVCISMHQYAQVCRSMHQHAYVSMHQHASACVCMHQHASVVYSLYTICIQSVLNLYKICIESVYNTQHVHNMYTIRIQPVYNLYENQHKILVYPQPFLLELSVRRPKLRYICSMAKRLTAEQFESQYGDTMRREYAEYVTPRTLMRALEHRRPRIPVSEGVLKVWFSKQAAPAGTITVSSAAELNEKYGDLCRVSLLACMRPRISYVAPCWQRRRRCVYQTVLQSSGSFDMVKALSI